VPSRLVKVTSLIALLALGSIFAREGSAVAVAPTEDAAPPKESPFFTPMSDAAAQGVGCLALTSPIMAVAYALGPTEIMMLVTGAVIVPSSSAQLFISLGGILGAAACGVGAVLTPSVMWAVEKLGGAKVNSDVESQKDPMGAEEIANGHDTGADIQDESAEVSLMGEDEIQGAGCLIGVLGLGAITLATVPIEIVGLAAGGVAVPSNTTILLLGIVGTVVPAGCTLGAAASLPLVALYRNFDINAIGQGLASIIGWGRSSSSPRALQAGAEEPKPEDRGPIAVNTTSDLQLDASLRVGRLEPVSATPPIL